MNAPAASSTVPLNRSQAADETVASTAESVPPTPTPAERKTTRRRVITAAAVMFIVLSAIALAYLAQSVLIPVALAWVISMTLEPPLRWLRRLHVPTTLAAAFIVVVFFAALALGVMNLGRPALDWISKAPEQLPRLREKFQDIIAPAARLSEAASNVSTLDTDGKKPQPVELKDNRLFSTVFTWTGSLLAGVGETIALVFLLLAYGDIFTQKMVRLAPRYRDKKQVVEIVREIQHGISRYLFSVGLINVCLGVVVGLALTALGMPNAWMWGGVAAIVNFIPYFGPFMGVGAIAMAGLLAFDTFGHGLMPAAAYLSLHLIESNFVTPHLLGRRFTLNPVVIFVALIFGIWLWGIIGALLAVPMLVTLQTICDRVPTLAPVGELISN